VPEERSSLLLVFAEEHQTRKKVSLQQQPALQALQDPKAIVSRHAQSFSCHVSQRNQAFVGIELQSSRWHLRPLATGEILIQMPQQSGFLRLNPFNSSSGKRAPAAGREYLIWEDVSNVSVPFGNNKGYQSA